MLGEHVPQIVFPTQFPHPLGDREFGVCPLHFQSDGQQIRHHLHEECRREPVAVQAHLSDMKNRFERLPEAFDLVVLLPNVPDFCPA
jgi:hypothetical protein